MLPVDAPSGARVEEIVVGALDEVEDVRLDLRLGRPEREHRLRPPLFHRGATLPASFVHHVS